MVASFPYTSFDRKVSFSHQVAETIWKDSASSYSNLSIPSGPDWVDAVNHHFEPYGALLEQPDGASAGGGATKTAGEWVIEVAVRKMQSKKSPTSKKADGEHEECITTSYEETKEARDCQERYVEKKCPFRRALLALETVPPFQIKCAVGGTVSHVKQEASEDMNGLPTAQNESLTGAKVVRRFGPGEKEKVSKSEGNSHEPYVQKSFFDEASGGEDSASLAAEDEHADEMSGGSPEEPDVRIEAWEMIDPRRSRPAHARDVAQSLGIEAARASIVQVRQMAIYWSRIWLLTSLIALCLGHLLLLPTE
jgi:hypothetical protein